MKVCAHFNPSSHQFFHRRFQSMAEAKRYFRDLIRECDVHPWDEDEVPTMSVALQCNDCSDMMNFHDFPRYRFELGRRGGLVQRKGY